MSIEEQSSIRTIQPGLQNSIYTTHILLPSPFLFHEYPTRTLTTLGLKGMYHHISSHVSTTGPETFLCYMR